ncbi:hypothetical protein ABZP36_024247, partial [Zizania latifolia]
MVPPPPPPLRSAGSGPEYAYLEMQYWAASISCLSVLAFFVWHLRQSTSNGISKALKYGSLFIILYPLAYFCLKTDRGLLLMSNVVYMLCHGVAAVILIQYILEKFPSCSSFGEAILLSGGLVLYCGDMLAHTLSKMKFSVSSEAFTHTPGNRSKISIVIQMLVYCRKLEKQRAQTVEEWTQKRIGYVVFYVSLLVALFLLVPSWMRLVQDFELHPFAWFYSISKQSKTERILLRKYYHLVAVLIFSPAVIFQPDLLDLAFGAAFAVFLILEMIRVWEIYPLGHIVHQFMNAFTDHRDSEILIVSHFSLLLGCALPKWMSSGFNDRPLAPFAGILSLGIGDTRASMIGYKYGVLRWSKTGKKTIEGTAAGITSVLVACSILVSLLASSGYILSQ